MSKVSMNDIYKQIGAMQGQGDLIKQSVDILVQKQNEHTVIFTEMKNDINSVHSRIDALIKDLNPTVEYANDWNETKKKAKYGALGIALTGLVSGTFIGTIIEKAGIILK